MEAIVINIILPMIQQLLPLFGTAGLATTTTVGIIIKGLQTAIPLLGTLATVWGPKIKNIIAVVNADPATTEAQRKALRALDAASDAAFDVALAAAEVEDAK